MWRTCVERNSRLEIKEFLDEVIEKFIVVVCLLVSYDGVCL